MKKCNANQSISCSVCHKRKSATLELSDAKPRVLTHLDSSWELSSLERESKTIFSSSTVCENHSLKSSRVIVEEQEDIFSNDDIAIEILSRLPIESTDEWKCVCKRWCELSSHPSFSIAHFQRSARTISGLFIQGIYYCSFCENYLDWDRVNYLSIGKERKHAFSENILDFLPEKVVVLASCNGILLCRNMFKGPDDRIDHHCERLRMKRYSKKSVLYVCNPFTKELRILRPRGKYKKVCYYGIAYNHYGSLGNPDFEVVMVQAPLQLGEQPYRFKIYSSRIGAWRTSKEVCTFHHRLFAHHSFFTKGVFYWLTTDHSILVFDLKQEKAEVIKLPGHALNQGVRGAHGMCLGMSEGKVHYICLNYIQLMVWVFENDDSKPKWVLIHTKSQLDMRHPLLEGCESKPFSITDGYKWANDLMYPYAFEDDILYVVVCGRFCTYNIKTGKFEEELCWYGELKTPTVTANMVIPYRKTLLQVQRKE